MPQSHQRSLLQAEPTDANMTLCWHASENFPKLTKFGLALRITLHEAEVSCLHLFLDLCQQAPSRHEAQGARRSLTTQYSYVSFIRSYARQSSAELERGLN
jgi:hypothetical protein